MMNPLERQPALPCKHTDKIRKLHMPNQPSCFFCFRMKHQETTKRHCSPCWSETSIKCEFMFHNFQNKLGNPFSFLNLTRSSNLVGKNQSSRKLKLKVYGSKKVNPARLTLLPYKNCVNSLSLLPTIMQSQFDNVLPNRPCCLYFVQ